MSLLSNRSVGCAARRAARLSLVLLLALTITARLTASAAAKSYRADRFDVDLVIEPDGRLLVTETVVFRFEGGPFTYVFRDLAFTELDDIEVIEARLDGQPLPSGTGPGQVEIRPGRPLEVTWHLPPTADATHTFTLVYRVEGAIRQLADADALFWRAIPEEHDYPIAAATITLRYPETVPLLGRPAVRGARAEIETGPGLVVATAEEIDEDEDVVIEARFPAGSLAAAPPRWQAAQASRQRQTLQALPFGLVAALLTALSGGGLLARSWRRYPHQPAPASVRQMARTEPPSDLAPALAVRLADGSMPALAALFDMAQAGVVSIEEVPTRWGRKFLVRRRPVAGSLEPHQQALLEGMFGDRAGLKESVDLAEAGRRMSTRQKPFGDALESQLIALGLFDAERLRYRRRLLVTTVLAMVLGIVVFVLGLVVAGVVGWRSEIGLQALAVAIGVGVGLFVVGFVGVILAGTFSPRTPAGEEQAAAWRRFGDYLKEVARGRQSLMQAEQFAAFLPYAAGFGLAEDWGKRYIQQTNVPLPAWFTGLQPGDGYEAFAAVMAAGSSWSGDSGSGGDGGGGASGGGASGAG